MIYFDNSATTFPKPESVYQAMDDTNRTIGANPGRGTYRMASAASQAVESARTETASFFRAERPEAIAFTYNATDALNMAINGVLDEGDVRQFDAGQGRQTDHRQAG